MHLNTSSCSLLKYFIIIIKMTLDMKPGKNLTNKKAIFKSKLSSVGLFSLKPNLFIYLFIIHYLKRQREGENLPYSDSLPNALSTQN